MAESSTYDNTEQILEDAKAAELQKEYEKERKTYCQNMLVLNIVKKLDVNQMSNLTKENKANIERYIEYLRVLEYLDDDNSMGGVVFTLPELSYMEQKALKAAAEPAILKYCKSILDFADKMDPRVFQLDEMRAKFAELVEGKKQSEQRLANLKAEYAQKLKEFVELKLSDVQIDAVKEMKLDAELHRIKAELLTSVTKDTIVCLNHAEEAMQSVDKHLDSLIEKKNAA